MSEHVSHVIKQFYSNSAQTSISTLLSTWSKDTQKASGCGKVKMMGRDELSHIKMLLLLKSRSCCCFMDMMMILKKAKIDYQPKKPTVIQSTDQQVEDTPTIMIKETETRRCDVLKKKLKEINSGNRHRVDYISNIARAR